MSWAIAVDNLTYKYPHASAKTESLKNITLNLGWHQRLVVVGPNGAGKTTLLKILSGRTLVTSKNILIDGKDPFMFSNDNITTFLSTDWILNSVIKRDMPVLELINSVGINELPERRDMLIEILDIDIGWNMNRISDGQRRRVQLLIKLFPYWQILLLDEVTVDLDVLVRLRLLNFLKKETETRRCCLVYATHIFDGLASLQFPTHVLHLREGAIERFLAYNEIEFVDGKRGRNASDETDYNDIEVMLKAPEIEQTSHVSLNAVHSIHPLALSWLTEDYKRAQRAKRAKR